MTQHTRTHTGDATGVCQHHTPACTANRCQQGRAACPVPQACELPTDEAPATAAELVSYLGVVLAAVAVVALLVFLAAGA